MSNYTSPEARAARATELFEDSGAILEGHFVYLAGHHGNAYVAKDETIKDPAVMSEIAGLMAENAAEVLNPDEIDGLVAAAPCASMIAGRMSEHLGNLWGVRPPRLYFAEKVPTIRFNSQGQPEIVEELAFKRGFDKEVSGMRLHGVEDVVNSGATIHRMVDLVTEQGGAVTGFSAEYNRTPSAVTAETLGIERRLWLPLVEKELSKAEPQDCTMCHDLETNPIRTDRGKGSKFLAELAVWAEAIS